MDMLILGGTQWLGRRLAQEAIARGHRVTSLARGEAGAVADGAVFVRGDRSLPGAYDEVGLHEWDAVIEDRVLGSQADSMFLEDLEQSKEITIRMAPR